MEQSIKNKLELVRAITRSAAFIIPLTTLCAALFIIESVQDTIVGAVIGSVGTAAIFYFKKSEDE